MSNRITNMIRPLQMSPAYKSVLRCLADRANEFGVCWPSIPRISEDTCLGRTAVIEAIQALKYERFLDVEKRGRKNVYRIVEHTVDLALAGIEQDKSMRREVRLAIRGRPLVEQRKVRQANLNGPRDGC